MEMDSLLFLSVVTSLNVINKENVHDSMLAC